MLKKQKDRIEKLEKYALDNYEKGGHWIYETHDDKDYLEILTERGTVPKAKKYLKETWTLRNSVYEGQQL